MKQYLLWLLCITTSVSFAQTNNQSKLTIDQIMQGEKFVGYSPTQISWSDDSQNIYFSWNPDLDTIRSSYKVNIKSKDISKRTFSELKESQSSGVYSKDYKWKVYSKNGD